LKKEVAILSGITSRDLATKIAEDLRMIEEIVPVEFRVFPDGESTVKINKNLERKYCIVIQSTYPPVDRHLIQTLMMIKKCMPWAYVQLYHIWHMQDKTELS
jgi:ribose-phosphate pyrophosphokinase